MARPEESIQAGILSLRGIGEGRKLRLKDGKEERKTKNSIGTRL